MTFTIPPPEWMSAERLAEDPNAGFQMYSPEANAEVARVVTILLEGAETTQAPRESVIIAIGAGVKAIEKRYPEVRDSEPEWAITDAVNAYFDTVGFVHVHREDLFL